MRLAFHGLHTTYVRTKFLFTYTGDLVGLATLVEDLTIRASPPLSEVKTIPLLTRFSLVTFQLTLSAESIVAVVAFGLILGKINDSITPPHRTHPLLSSLELSLGVFDFVVPILILPGESFEGRMIPIYLLITSLKWAL